MRSRWLMVIIALLLGGCGRATWQAVGYVDRANPEAGKISLGTFGTESEARGAGIGYVKGDSRHDYIIGILNDDGTLRDTRR